MPEVLIKKNNPCLSITARARAGSLDGSNENLQLSKISVSLALSSSLPPFCLNRLFMILYFWGGIKCMLPIRINTEALSFRKMASFCHYLRVVIIYNWFCQNEQL